MAATSCAKRSTTSATSLWRRNSTAASQAAILYSPPPSSSRRWLGDDEQRIAQTPRSHVLEERRDRLGVLLGAGHQMRQNLGAAGGMPPGRPHRLAPLPRTQPFGDPVDEQVGDVVFGEIPARKLLVVRPQARADLRELPRARSSPGRPRPAPPPPTS